MRINESNNVDDEKSGTKKSADQHDQKTDQHAEDAHSGDHAGDHAHEADGHVHAGEHAHGFDGHGDGGHGAQTAMDYYMDPGHLFAHVQDATYFEVPKFISSTGHIDIPNITGFTKASPMIGTAEKPFFVGRPTKFMILELLAALLISVAFIWLARKVGTKGERPKGKLWNMLESMVLFIRDDIARPTIGAAHADRYLPFLLTLFFFILALNLFGMIPFMGSATGALGVTAVLALTTFAVVLGAGMKRLGVVGFLKAQVPHLDGTIGKVLTPPIWCIEIFGLFIKHFVLAIRLFANMFAGHLVLAVFLGFIGVAWGGAMVYGVAPVVVIASIALSLLELFVAFLQAFVFTFLASLFIGAALHPH